MEVKRAQHQARLAAAILEIGGFSRSPRSWIPIELRQLRARVDCDAGIRLQVVLEIGKLSDRSQTVLEALHELLSDSNPNVCIAAIDVITYTKNPQSVDFLHQRISHVDGNVRWKVVDALGNFSDPRSIYVVLDRLQDDASVVRAAAARVLGRFHASKILAPLTAATSDSDKFVQQRAVESLTKIMKPANGCR
jgi:HEAT repeat protein